MRFDRIARGTYNQTHIINTETNTDTNTEDDHYQDETDEWHCRSCGYTPHNQMQASLDEWYRVYVYGE